MRSRSPFRCCLVLLAALPGAGCKLIDQRTFVAHADAPPVVHVPPGPPASPSVPPLLAVRFPATPDQWSGPVKVAVGLVLSRKPDALFTVESVVPASLPPEQAAARLARATADAEAIAAAIVADGADPLEVQLTAATDPSVTGETIRVYVR